MRYKKPKIVSRETLLPVPVADLIFQLGADDIDYPEASPERQALESYLISAVGWVENYTGQIILGGVFEFSLDCFPYSGKAIVLPIHPTISIVSLVYDDLDGQEQSITLDDLNIDTNSNELIVDAPDGWPVAQKKFNSVRVRVQAGMVYTDTIPEPDVEINVLPAPLKIAILMMARHYRDNASALAPVQLNQVPLGVESHCDQYRLDWI